MAVRLGRGGAGALLCALTRPAVVARPLDAPASSGLGGERRRRMHSFESGRGNNGKKPKTALSVDGASVAVRVSNRSRLASSRPMTATETLPFTPLAMDHLAHVQSGSMMVDEFFSLGRPLLEIELQVEQRRSATHEVGDDVLSPSIEASQYEGSPSDPAFKSPQSDSTSRLDSFSEGGWEEEVVGSVDAYESYLVTEPEGVDPSWARGTSQILASLEPHVPPPLTNHEEVDQDTLNWAEAKVRAAEVWNDKVMSYMSFLAPFGIRCVPTSPLGLLVDDWVKSTHSQPSSSSSLVQDPHVLTLTASRFLLSNLTLQTGEMKQRWQPTSNQLDSALEHFSLVSEVIQMDSTKRKRLRKMNVHKYKKRRKAQRALRKRQGRD